MPLNITDLTPFISDPVRVQHLILNNITQNQINEPTNPFTMLLEASTVLAGATKLETTAALRGLHPSLALDTPDLLAHINDSQLSNIYSYPGSATIVFYINAIELRANGSRDPAQGSYTTIIPAGTTVTVAKTEFTLFNDIRIILYDTGAVFTEQLTSTDPAANNSIGVIPSGIVSFENQTPFVALETTLKQLSKRVINKAITTSEGFTIDVLHSNLYHNTRAYYKNAATNNLWTPLAVTHSDVYIDPANPSISATVLTGKVTYSIPDIYLLTGQVSGEVMLELYETQGVIDIPIYKFQMSDYAVKLNTLTNNALAATIANITVYANSRGTASGGKSGSTFQELRTSIINNSLGNTVRPVTTDQLSRLANLQGFELYNVLDTVTSNIYTAARNLTRYPSNLVYTRPDVYFNTVGIEPNKIGNSNVIINNTYMMIPSDTLFKEVNGVTTILNDIETNTLLSMQNDQLVTHLRTNDIYFTPYYYIIDLTTTGSVNTKVYDLDTPVLRDIRITGTNISQTQRVNIGKYGLTRIPGGYELVVTVLSGDGKAVEGQLTVPMFNGNSSFSIKGVYDATAMSVTFRLYTDFNINSADQINITNPKPGLVSQVSNITPDLISRAVIHLYSTDPTIVDPNGYLKTDIVVEGTNTTYTVLDREELTIEFGRRVLHIWDRMFVTYNQNQYVKYGDPGHPPVPMIYQKDVYQVDPATGSVITVVTDPVTGVKSTSKTLLHAAGTPMLDAAGNPVYQHAPGSIVLDANSNPMINQLGGVIRHCDILMLEYHYLAANSLIQKNYLQAVRDTLNGWLFTDIPAVATQVLEHVSVLYHSYKRSEPVSCLVESLTVQSPYKVSPVVTLYTTKANYTDIELTNLRTEIGYMIHSYLDNTHVDISALKTDIQTNVDSSIVAVKITGIETSNNSEMLTVTDPMRRIGLNKVLTVNTNNELVVEYDITLKTHVV